MCNVEPYVLLGINVCRGELVHFFGRTVVGNPNQIEAFPFQYVVLFSAFPQRLKEGFFWYMKSIPFVQKAVDKELGKTISTIEHKFIEENKGIPYVRALPKHGFSRVRSS